MVEIENLSLAYAPKTPVLSDISLSVRKGECLLIAGKSGSGKSSLIHVCNGLAAEFLGAKIEGSVQIGTRDIQEMPIYEVGQIVSSVFQNPKTHFFNVDTTLELVFFLENIGLSRDDMRKRLADMLALFPIRHLMDRDIFKLSGGEKQILCVAAAYIAGTEVIVFDEPTANLDAHYTRVLVEMLRQLKEQNVTLILAEHRMHDVAALADRVLLLEGGRVDAVLDRDRFWALDEDVLGAKGIRSRKRPVLACKKLPERGALHIRQLKISLGKRRGIDMRNMFFEKGRVYGIVGRNGCGKSTFLRALIGVERTLKDEIFYENKRLTKTERIAMSGLVMQDVHRQLFAETVEKEITLGGAYEKQRLDRILGELDLEPLCLRHPHSLSGGEKQRVAVATALYRDVPLLFFDEPTSGMDYENMLRIAESIAWAAFSERIVFVVSHDIDFLNIVADGVVDMEVYQIGE